MEADDLLDHLEAKYGPAPGLRGWLCPVVHRILTLKAGPEAESDLLVLVVEVYRRDVRVRRKLEQLRRALAESHRKALGRS